MITSLPIQHPHSVAPIKTHYASSAVKYVCDSWPSLQWILYI